MVEIVNQQKQVLLGRFHGCTEATPPSNFSLQGWPAYNGNQAIGLNPSSWYPYLPAERYDRLQITSLPSNTMITNVREGTNYLAVQLSPRNGRAGTGRLDFQSDKLPQLILRSDAQPFAPSPGNTSLEVANSDLVVFLWDPPLTPGFPDKVGMFTKHAMGTDGLDRYLIYPDACYITATNLGGGEWEFDTNMRPSNRSISMDMVLLLPSSGQPALRFTPSVSDSKSSTNSLGLEIQVNGETVFSDTMTSESTSEEQEIDLSNWLGQPILLTVITHRGTCWVTTAHWKHLRLE